MGFASPGLLLYPTFWFFLWAWAHFGWSASSGQVFLLVVLILFHIVKGIAQARHSYESPEVDFTPHLTFCTIFSS